MNPEASNPPPPPPKLARASIVLVAILLAAFLIALIPRLRHRAALATETRELAVPTVAVISPAPGKPAAGLPLAAEVKPWIEAPIYARASGYLKRWLVDIGATVREGQLLAEIETPELDQQLERARHDLAQAEAALALAKITADRYTELLKTASVAEQETAEKQADLVLKTAGTAGARSEVRRLEELKAFARVTAPFGGVITARNTDVGNLITAGGGQELFRLAQTDRLRVYVRVPQTEALDIAPGQTAELLIPERPKRVFHAKVIRAAGAITADSRTLLTELEADNVRGEILAGSFGQVRLTAAKGEAPLVLPANTLLFRAEGPQVGVVRPDGKVELRSVKLGHDFGATLEIVSGVSTNDHVILNPSDSLESGATVRAVAVTKPEAARPGKAK
jgi:membrane fusion protein (multidrug efflux system)